MRIIKPICIAVLLIICTPFILLVMTVKTIEAAALQSAAYVKEQTSANRANHSNDLWVRLRNGFELKAFDGKAIRQHEISYTRHPKYIYRIIERSKPYLYHIMEEVERRGMPTEIVLLPLVESAFDPKAKSNSNALGLWQFIPSTGESYGLIQNKWHDDRKDIILATNAALDYLQKLHTIFDDWKLALAAYNWGKTAVRQSIARNDEKGRLANFRYIKLPPETRNHVYKLIAVRNIIAAPEKFGIKLDAIPNQPYFAEIKINYSINISHVTQLARISIDEFNALNPAYKLGVIKVADTPRTLLLPVEKKEIFLRNRKFYNSYFKPWQMFQAKKDKYTDENIRPQKAIFKSQKAISEHLNVVNEIKKNSVIMSKQSIPVPSRKRNVGADINIVQKKPIEPNRFGKSRRRNGLKNALTYIVKKGDTLYGIARQHGLTVAQIKYWNDDNEHLSVGQELVLLPDTSTILH